MPVLSQFIGTSGFIGLAPEVTKGTGVAATQYLPLLDGESIEHDPGIVTQKMIRASRAEQSLPFVGEQKISGKLPTLLFPDQGLLPLAQAIGSDTYQSSSAAGTTVAIGGTGVTSGANVVTLATQTSTPVAAGDYLQLQQATGAPGVANLSEVHKVLSVSGAGPYTVTLAVGEATVRAYTASGVVARIPAATVVFTHQLVPDQPNASFYKTFSIEKNFAQEESVQYAGSVVDTFDISVATKDAVKADYGIMALSDSIVSATTPVYGTSQPLSLSGYSVSLFGAGDTSVNSFSLSGKNGVKPYPTFNQSALPSIAPPTVRSISGKWTNIVQNDTYRTTSIAGTTGAVVLTLAQGANSVAFNCPKAIIKKLSTPLKLGDLLMYNVDFDVLLSESSGYDMSVTVINGNWLPLI